MNRLRHKISTNIDGVGAEPTKAISSSTCQDMIAQYTILIMRHDLLRRDELADIFLRRATLHSCIGDHSNALADAVQSLGLRPDQSVGYYRAGHACFKLGQYSEAAGHFRDGMNRSPGSKRLANAFRCAMQELLRACAGKGGLR